MLSSSFAHPKLAAATKDSANARRHILGEVVHLRREEVLGVIEVMEVLLDYVWTGIRRWGLSFSPEKCAVGLAPNG